MGGAKKPALPVKAAEAKKPASKGKAKAGAKEAEKKEDDTAKVGQHKVHAC